MRTAHYWRKAGKHSCPNEIIVFDCETHFGKAAEHRGGELQKLRLGHAIAYRLEKGKRTRVSRITFRKSSEFWDFVRRRLSKSRPVWLFAHNIPYDLGCVSGWKLIATRELKTTKAAVTGTLFFLKGELDGKPITLCDTCNYFRSSLKSIGQSVGLPKMEMPDYEAPDREWEVYCKNDVDVTALAIDSLIGFIREHSLGPWQPSIAGLSFAAYRACFMEHKVLVHSYPSILSLERRCYYGGIVDTPTLGRAPSHPVWELDVCSMYPAVCRYDLPVRYKHDSQRYGVEGIRRLAEKFSVCADVEIASEDTPYPIRQKKGTYFACGNFHTSLAHPELMLAIERKHIRRVHRVAWYTRAPIFKDYMEWFTAKKQDYQRLGLDAFRTLCKMYNTNLYGKTGQKTPVWREWNEDTLRDLEAQHNLKPGTLKNHYDNPPTLYEPEESFRFRELDSAIAIRDYYGIVEIKIREVESRESCPIIAATVTSYARVLLRRYQEIAGRGHWFYSDTDSIWVDDEGKRRLEHANCVREDILGYLSIKDRHEWLDVHGPKDYETPSTWKLKGVKKDAKLEADGGWTQLQFPSALAQMKDGFQEGVFVRRITKHLKRVPTKCWDNGDGTTRPLKFPSENPERQG